MRLPVRLTSSLALIGLVASCAPQPATPPAPDQGAPNAPPSAEPVVLPRPVVPPPPVKGEQPNYPYALPAAPEVGPNEVAGTVVSRGAPASGIPLTVMGGGKTHRVSTDANGVFRVKNLAPGDYYAHYYNDSDNNKVGFWKTQTLRVTNEHGAVYPAWDVFLVGMRNRPAQGASVRFPFTVEFEPYPLAITYRFRIHDRGGPGGQALYISEKIPARGVQSFTFSGASNQTVAGGLGGGRYLWGYQWEAGKAGEGGCLFQDFTGSGGLPATRGATF